MTFTEEELLRAWERVRERHIATRAPKYTPEMESYYRLGSKGTCERILAELKRGKS